MFRNGSLKLIHYVKNDCQFKVMVTLSNCNCANYKDYSFFLAHRFVLNTKYTAQSNTFSCHDSHPPLKSFFRVIQTFSFTNKFVTKHKTTKLTWMLG